MKRSLPFLVLTLCTSLALAEPPAPTGTSLATSALVHKKLVKPLQRSQAKRSRFSRSRPAPARRRVRVLDKAEQTDTRGKRYVRFAVDERQPWDDDDEWNRNRVVGCAYLDEGLLFVQRGDTFLPAKVLLGKKAKPRAGVCRPAATAAAAAAPSERQASSPAPKSPPG